MIINLYFSIFLHEKTIKKLSTDLKIAIKNNYLKNCFYENKKE